MKADIDVTAAVIEKNNYYKRIYEILADNSCMKKAPTEEISKAIDLVIFH